MKTDHKKTSLQIDPEFVRLPELQARTGLKRNICYRRIKDGTFESILIREKGNKHGIRLVYWPSVERYLHKLMAEQGGTAGGTR